VVIGTLTVCLSSAFRFLMSIGPSGVDPVSLPVMILRSVKMTSSAVSGLPSWNVMSGRSLMIHSDVDPFGLMSSASTNSA
jgi:hypothetical protein